MRENITVPQLSEQKSTNIKLMYQIAIFQIHCLLILAENIHTHTHKPIFLEIRLTVF